MMITSLPIKAAFALVFLSGVAHAQLRSDGATASFLGSLPPKPSVEVPSEQLHALDLRLKALSSEFANVRQHARAADADIFLKAVRYALEFHEWYDKKPEDCIKKANALLDEAARRIQGLKANQTAWLNGTGQKVVGFYSKIDGSPQPYGVEIPESLRYGQDQKSVPMWIWLHGRGDTSTDLYFVYNQLTAKKPGQFQPKGTIVIHPFGRYCNGWKSAGETDVFEARDDAISRFHVDRERIAIAGFSMGGAGAWHLGAHFADQWACVHTGAGFVDVKRYQKLTPAKMPVWFEQKLWGIYDVPNYARNFENVPLVCYSGENDPQRDSAEYMVEELSKIGIHPPHLIGPGMGHKYHPAVIQDVQAKIEEAVVRGRNPMPKRVVLHTRTLAYSRMHWLQITSMPNHWDEAIAEANWDDQSGVVRIQTVNVDGLSLQFPPLPAATNVSKVIVDGVEPPNAKISHEHGFRWEWKKNGSAPKSNAFKKPGLQGPMDDGFRSRFAVVLPDAAETDSAVDRWTRQEAAHFLTRWRSLMRGDAIVVKPNEITQQIAQECHLVVWGTPSSNSLLKRLLATQSLSSVLSWDKDMVQIGTHRSPADRSVPVLGYPNPLNPERYVIINTGLTFREAHDRTNSIQNPKLPDWAILDITQPPDAEAAGKVVSADFFDNNWTVAKKQGADDNQR